MNTNHALPKAVFILGIFLIGTMAAQPLPAAQPDAEATGAVPWDQVALFEVAPLTRTAALLAPNAQAPLPPDPLDDRQKAQILTHLPDGQGNHSTDHPSDTFVLTAASAVQEGKGILTLLKPHSVHPETGIHMQGIDEGSVGVKIRVEKGGRYLVDFRLKSAVPGVYRVQVEGQTQEISDPEGARQHVLLMLNAISQGWTTIRLDRPESDFMLYAVEVTSFR